MVTSTAKLYGSALIGHSYHIEVRVGKNNERSSAISIVEGVGTGPITHQSRSTMRAAADFVGNKINFFEVDPRESPHWRPAYTTDAGKADKKILHKRVQNIKKSTQHSAGRQPESKERQAMARLQSLAQGIVGKAKCSNEFGVKHQTHFKVITIRANKAYKARLYTAPQGKLIATGAGVDHYAAMEELQEDVGRRASERELEKLKAEEAKNFSMYRDFF